MKWIALLGAVCLASCASSPGAEWVCAVVETAPVIDGRGDDAAWRLADPLEVEVTELEGDRKGETEWLQLRCVRTTSDIYIRVDWPDKTKDDTHKSWDWNAQKRAYEQGPDREDVVALAFPIKGDFDADMLSGIESVWDVWQWKAARTGPSGHAMDKTHHTTRSKPDGKAKSFKANDGRIIWIARPEDEGNSVQKSRSAPAGRTADRVAQYVKTTPSGSAADIRAAGAWDNGRWTVEFARKLNTGHSDDTAFDLSKTYRMGIAIFDREEHIDHSASKVIELRFASGRSTGQRAGQDLDPKLIEEASGTKATVKSDGVVRIGWARTDVAVKVDGMPLEPFAGLGSWAAFTPTPHGAMVMGDTVVFQDEVSPAMDAAFSAGLEVTALHNHFFFDEPKVYFMHIGGSGDPARLAAGVKAIWDAIKKVRAASPRPATRFDGGVPAAGKIGAAGIEKILGLKANTKGGVVKFSVGRQGKMHGTSIRGTMGLGTWAAFSGTDALASIDGDFIMTAKEVQPVLQALRKGGIHVVALHNHMVGDEPAFYFVHYWSKGPAEELARSFKAVLDAQTKVGR